MIRGVRDIMHRMQCTWEALANVEERRSGGAEERQNIQTVPSRCFPIPGMSYTTQPIRGRSTQFGTFGPMHAT